MELSFAELKELLVPTQTHCYPVGKNVLIRTISFYYTGLLVEVTNQELVLENVAWIADTGRFNEALTNGTFSEIEIFPKGKVLIGRGAIVDCCEWTHPLPSESK